MQLFSEISPLAWTLGQVQTTQNRKGIPIVDQLNQHVEVKLCENTRPLRVPFQPSNFDKDDTKTRLSCVLVLEPEQITWLAEIERWAVQTISQRASEIDWTPEQVASYFKSSVKTNEKFGVTQFSVKLNTAGRFRIQFWNSSMVAMEDELMDLVDQHIVPIVKLRGIWIQAGTKMWGLSWDMTNAMLQRRSFVCPFIENDDKENTNALV